MRKEEIESFINDFDEDSYRKILSNPNKLGVILENYNNKFNENYSIDTKLLFFKESLDYYVISKINDREFTNSQLFRNYINYTYNLINNNPLEVNTNPFLSLDDNIIKNIYGDNNFKIIKNKKINQENQINNIINNIKEGKEISQNDLDEACKFYSLKRDIYNPNYGVLLTKIFSDLQINSNLKCTLPILNCILNDIPKEYEFNYHNKFNPRMIRIGYGNHMGNSNTKIGLSNGNFCFLNMDTFKNISFKSIEDSNKTFSGKGSDFTFLMIVAFHELAHNEQSYCSKREQLTNEGIIYAMKSINNLYLSDYCINHDNDEIEIDATAKGWEKCENFYEKYIRNDIPTKNRLTTNCFRNTVATKARQYFAYKKDNNGNQIPMAEYDFLNTQIAIKKNPNLLKRVPCLEKIFNPDGSLNNKSLFNEDFGMNASAMQVEFFMKYMEKENINNLVNMLNKASKQQVTNFVNNLYEGILANASTPSNMIEYKDRNKLVGDYDKFDEETEVERIALNQLRNKFAYTLPNALQLFDYSKQIAIKQSKYNPGKHDDLIELIDFYKENGEKNGKEFLNPKNRNKTR